MTGGYEQVAWVTGGSPTNLRASKRHLVKAGALDPRGAVPQVTLCGLHFRRSALVPTNDYWTDGDCGRCVRVAAQS